MVSCKIKGCKNRSDGNKGLKKLHFYSFPKDKDVVEKWIAVCKKSVNLRHSRVCSDHFTPSSYKPHLDHLKDITKHRSGVRTLLPNAVPTENIVFEDAEKSSRSKPACKAQHVVKKENQNVSNVTQLTKSNGSTVLFVRMIDNKIQPQIISSTVIPSEKYVTGNANLDVRLEKLAPAHVLDHQYAVYNESSIKSSDHDSQKKMKENDTSSNLSNQKLINQLKMKLRMKTIQQQNLQNQLKRLQNDTQNIVNKQIRDILKNVFSPRQIDRLINPYKGKIKWSIEDIISAIGLQNISLKAYEHLRENNYPLPGSSTIRKWAAHLNLSEGILADVLPVMKYKAKLLSVFQKIVVLNFGQMNIMDEKCTICIVRGLFYEWMQLIYYSYNRLTINVFNEIISKLYEIGYIVVAIMCDIDSNDSKIWSDLNIGIENNEECYFVHPNNSSYKIFVFPHDTSLLALTRKYYLEYGFIIKNKIINRQCIEEIININKQLEGDEFHIVTDELLTNCKSNEKNASLAKKLFSKTIAREISSYGEEGITMYKDWKETANFFKYFGEWIDLFNSSVKEGCKEGEEPYGISLEQQNNILNQIEEIVHTMRIESSETLLPFQEQIILRCRSLKQLLTFLQEFFSIEDFPIRYIFANRFNSNLIKNVTKYLTHSKLPNRLSKVKFQTKLRKCILGKFSSDDSFNKFLKFTEPCLIDFNERSNSASSQETIDVKPKSTSSKEAIAVKSKSYVSDTAVKMRKFLSENQISENKVHKNLLQLINKQT